MLKHDCTYYGFLFPVILTSPLWILFLIINTYNLSLLFIFAVVMLLVNFLVLIIVQKKNMLFHPYLISLISAHQIWGVLGVLLALFGTLAILGSSVFVPLFGLQTFVGLSILAIVYFTPVFFATRHLKGLKKSVLPFWKQFFFVILFFVHSLVNIILLGFTTYIFIATLLPYSFDLRFGM